MINWGLWSVHLFISTLIVAGMIVAYSRLWMKAFRSDALPAPTQRLARAGLTVAPGLLALVLMVAQYVDPINWMMYMNMQLFVLAYPLLDEEISLLEFHVRAFMIVGFWLWEHHLTSFREALMLLIFIGTIMIMRRQALLAHYNVWINGLVAIALAFAFWDPQERVNGAPEFAPILTFVLVNLMCFVYWSNLHRQDLHQRALAKRASLDALTNARTYARFQEDVTQLFDRARRADQPLTIVMLDIDHFKVINDSYGHLAGNQVLSGVARILADTLTAHDAGDHQIYRTGGEEFNILFYGHSPESVLPIVQDCWQAIRTHTFEAQGRDITATISVGVTGMRATDQNVNAIYKRADENLYRSKRAGRDTITIEYETLKPKDQRVGETAYAFFAQPIVNGLDRAVLQYELLLRTYDNHQREWVLPPRFDLDMTLQLGLVSRALTGLTVKSVALNLTQAQFASEDVAYQIVEYVSMTPHLDRLVVEVTALPDDPEIARAVLAIYHSGQVEAVLDDVGMANKRPAIDAVIDDVDGIKLSLINLRKELTAGALVQRVADWRDYATAHHKRLTIEGIENEADESMLLSLGVTRLQGFYYSRPLLPQYK